MAKYALNDRQNRIVPMNFKPQIFFHANSVYWYIADINEIVNGKSIYMKQYQEFYFIFASNSREPYNQKNNVVSAIFHWNLNTENKFELLFRNLCYPDRIFWRCRILENKAFNLKPQKTIAQLLRFFNASFLVDIFPSMSNANKVR